MSWRCRTPTDAAPTRCGMAELAEGAAGYNPGGRASAPPRRRSPRWRRPGRCSDLLRRPGNVADSTGAFDIIAEQVGRLCPTLPSVRVETRKGAAFFDGRLLGELSMPRQILGVGAARPLRARRASCDVGALAGGEGGIRTLDGLMAHTPLAGERLRPLGHLSVCVQRLPGVPGTGVALAGAPSRIRTCNPQLRRLMPYPVWPSERGGYLSPLGWPWQ